MDTGSFPGVERSGRGVDQSLLSRAEVKEKVELYLYPPPLWAFTACYGVNFLFYD